MPDKLPWGRIPARAQAVIMAVAHEDDVLLLTELMTMNRVPRIQKARARAWWLLRQQEAKYSLAEIGSWWGVSHSSVKAAVDELDRKMELTR